ncbi:MAG: hypothetical protein PVJ39_10635 [Gammaproteobacteria bacterium]|jgi:hypothetical protein
MSENGIPRSAVTSGDYVYVAGAMGDNQVLNSVEVTPVADNGQLGNIGR